MAETEKSGTTGRKSGRLGRWLEDLLVLATGQMLSKVFGFLAFAWLARQLTLEEYGALETAVGMAAIGAVALELGTGSAGVRRIAQSEGEAPDILGAVISVRFAIALVVAPLLALIYIELTKSSAFDALFWLFAASLFAVPLNHSWFFQSQERMFVAGFGQTLKMSVFLLAALIIVPQRTGVVHVAFAEIIAAAAMAIWYSAFAFNWTRRLKLRRSIDAGTAMFRESASLGLSSLVNALAQYLPLLIVATMADDSQTALFGASQRLVLSLATFSFIYFFNLYPLIARRLTENPEALDRLMSASARVVSWAGVAVSGTLCAAGPFIMGLVFGADYEAAGAEFGALIWITATMLMLGNAKWLLTAGGRQGSLLLAHLVTAAVVVGLGFLLTPWLGGFGAAIACNAGFLAQWAVVHSRTRGMAARPRLADNLPALTAAIVIIAILAGLRPSPLAGGGIVVAVVTFGVALDRKFLPSLRMLAGAKAAAG